MSVKVAAIKEEPSPSILSTGLALFSMFFGAGNIIFPLVVGRLAGTEILYAVLGLGVSAVLFPFLGLIAMMFYGGDIHSFLSRVGKWPAFVLLILLQMSQGPVGSMPRLVTLMHASIKSFLPELSLFWFSVVICVVILVLTIRPHRVIHLLGTILTPLLLLSLATLVGLGIWWAPAPEPVYEGSLHHFGQGLKAGYQTMDLTAALLFASMIMPHLSQGTSNPKVIRRRMMGASLIASALLMVTYMGLGGLAAYHSWTVANVPPEDLLHAIAVQLFGRSGGYISTLTVFLTCLTTAISLSAVFSSYLENHLLKGRIRHPLALGMTLAVTALFANLGFGGIAQLWGPILEGLYPVLIVLCVVNILLNRSR